MTTQSSIEADNTVGGSLMVKLLTVTQVNAGSSPASRTNFFGHPFPTLPTQLFWQN